MAFKEEFAICELLHIQWKLVEQLHRVLKPLYQATIVMQRADFTMSDFYASWNQAEEILTKMVQKGYGGELASLLLTNMEKRKHVLLENPAMLCAILLDPRFCCELKDEKKEKAIDTILNLWKKIKAFMESKTPSDDINDTDDSIDEDISIESTTMLKRYMEKKEAAQQKKTNPYSANVFAITEEIESFIEYDHDVPDGGIHDFWHKNQLKFPRLFILAEIVYAISPTQAIVERAFSTLSHLYPPKRNQLLEGLLDDSLVICLNEELLVMVNEEDIEAIVANSKK